MKSKWLVYAKKADFKAIEQKYGIDQVVARIMRNRDVCTDEEMQMYLNGSIEGLRAPELLKDAQKAVEYFNGKKSHSIKKSGLSGITILTEFVRLQFFIKH